MLSILWSPQSWQLSLPRQSLQWRSPSAKLRNWRKIFLGYGVIISMVGIAPVMADEAVDPADPAFSYEDGTFINPEDSGRYNYRNENEYPYRNENEYPYRNENEYPYRNENEYLYRNENETYQNENKAGYRDYNNFNYRDENTFDYQPVD